MKLLIMPCIDRPPGQEQESTLISLERLVNILTSAANPFSAQEIELQDHQSALTQINSALKNLDINTLLNPDMPNSGGMEVIATIKRNLSLELEAVLTTQKN
jgi:hypothetical protein